MEFWVTQAVNQSRLAQGGLVGVSSTRPYLVRPILWIQARARMLTQRMLTQRMLTQRILTQRMLMQRMLTQRMLMQRMLTQRM